MKQTLLIGLAAISFGSMGALNAQTPGRAETHPNSPSIVVGTWRWDWVREAGSKKNQKPSYTFYMRFYADGAVASWPTPDGKVSRGRYSVRVDGQNWFLKNGERETPMRISASEFWLTNEEGDVVHYQRITPELEPGNR